MMDDLLMGTPVAPLYKALRESGLGESVISDGLETVLQQALFLFFHSFHLILPLFTSPRCRDCSSAGILSLSLLSSPCPACLLGRLLMHTRCALCVPTYCGLLVSWCDGMVN